MVFQSFLLHHLRRQLVVFTVEDTKVFFSLQVDQVLQIFIYGQLSERRLHQLISKVVERSLETNTLLEVEVIWLAVKILVTHQGLEVRNETG